MTETGSGLIAGDFSKQWEWHEAYRDMTKNMYRTSYMDMSHGKEVHVKSDYPSGYGGHVPSIRHDVLFRNTSFDRQAAVRRSDPSRDAHPSFIDHISGIPTVTRFPQGAKKTPSFGVVPHDGTTSMLKPPWGIQTSKRDPLNYRCPPPTMVRVGSGSALGRSNEAAKNAGSVLAGYDAGSDGGAMMYANNSGMSDGRASPNFKRTVTYANQEAQKARMPSESEILRAQMA